MTERLARRPSIAKFEEGVKADTKAARAKAANLQAQIDAATKERTALAATLPTDVLTDYERLLKQFRGLGRRDHQGQHPHGLPHRAAGIVHERPQPRR